MGDILGQSSKKEDLAGLVLFDGNSYFEKNKKDGANALSLLSVFRFPANLIVPGDVVVVLSLGDHVPRRSLYDQGW